jgi:thiol:disulfide interchange protein DsbC
VDKNRTLIFTIVLIVFSVIANFEPCYADSLIKKTADSFKKDYPSVQADNIEKTAIEGLYEVTAGGNVFYYHEKSGNILFGEMITKNFKNITADRRNNVVASFLKSLPLDKAIRIGNGKNTVIEVLDIDCPYCRKVEEFFEKKNDLSRYVFLFPLEKIHPKSFDKSVAVLCSKNPAESLRQAMKGRYDKEDPAPCPDAGANKLLAEHMEISRNLGVRGTPALWINGVSIPGANIPQIEQLLPSNKAGKEVKP